MFEDDTSSHEWLDLASGNIVVPEVRGAGHSFLFQFHGSGKGLQPCFGPSAFPLPTMMGMPLVRGPFHRCGRTSGKAVAGRSQCEFPAGGALLESLARHVDHPRSAVKVPDASTTTARARSMARCQTLSPSWKSGAWMSIRYTGAPS